MNVFHCAAALFFAALFRAAAQSFLPTADGTTWDYEVRGQPPDSAAVTTLSVRIAGTEQLGARELLKVETRADEILTKTELIEADDTGIRIYRRTSAERKAVVSDPPQTLVPASLKIGVKWELDDRAAGTEMHQQFTVAAQESVTVPAGTYQAYRLHCEQPWPLSTTIDRWFVPGVGFVKDVTTVRGPSGRLLSRVTTSLKRLSQTPAPGVSVAPATPKITLEVAAEPEGSPKKEFRSDVANIFVRWSGEHLPINADLLVAWVAEDVGDIAPHNFIIDDTETTITQSEYGARFTLSRPKDGWAEGKYRVDLYLDDIVMQSVNVTIHD